MIRIRRERIPGHDQARKTAENFAEKLQAQFYASDHRDQDDLRFSARGVDSNLHLDDDVVEIQTNLGIIYLPFKAKSEKPIIPEIDNILNA